MLGWTKKRKRCPTHGLVLRKRESWYQDADYCPACGQKLIYIGIPYLFKIYFHPAFGSIFAGLILLCALLYFCDTRGCIKERRIANAAWKAKMDIIFEKFPQEWQLVISSVKAVTSGRRLGVFEDCVENKKLPPLTGEQLEVFLELFMEGYRDNVIEIVTAIPEEK